MDAKQRWPSFVPFAALALAALAAGCGDDGAGGDDDHAIDAAVDDAALSDAGHDGAPGDADAAPLCDTTWQLEYRTATAIDRFDPAPANAARATRVIVTLDRGPCEALAMPRVALDPTAREVTIEPAFFRPIGGSCGEPAATIQRPVVLALPAPGLWRIHAGPAGSGAPFLEIEVEPAPASPCTGAGGPCLQDCDCLDGERCLGGVGLGGVFLSCGRPCELDRDCSGNGRCADVDDGLFRACEPTLPECGRQAACPDGYRCDSGACLLDVALGSATRIPCACDADCTPPLRCAEPLGGEGGAEVGGRRCEILCPTGGPWCSGPHACGTAADDLSGLADTDSVCGWLGE